MGRLHPSSRALVSILALAAAFAAGAASRGAWPKEARAQSVFATSTIYMGSDGIVFRAPDGKAVARLSRDARGAGVFELFDEGEEVGARLAPAALSAPRPSRARAPYVLDDEDPFMRKGGGGPGSRPQEPGY